MNIKDIVKYAVLIAIFGFLFKKCSPAGGENPGREYMPDMAHSIAYESNKYEMYSNNTWDNESTFKRKELTNPHLPVNGTIPRGYAGLSGAASYGDMMNVLTGQDAHSSIRVPINGSVPYRFGDTDEERIRATNEYGTNPFPITATGLESGKQLYNIYCGICHGEGAGGNGYLARDGGKYPAQPANLLDSAYMYSSNGRYYHAIMYGKNVMGGYAEKLSYEERWNVIHYIRALQAKSKTKVYSEAENTFIASFGTPKSAVPVKVAAEVKPVVNVKPTAASAAHK
jgi:mono/diheme cytochrome c family protein